MFASRTSGRSDALCRFFVFFSTLPLTLNVFTDKAIDRRHQWDGYSCDQWDDGRRQPPYNMVNCCTRRNIVWECQRSAEKCWQGEFLASWRRKAHRLTLCERLDTISNKGDDFLSHIVICDETRVHHYFPQSKQASMEWREPGETATRKAKTRLPAGKDLATFFWDCRGISLVDILHERRAVDAAYYYQLSDEVKLAYRRKRRDMSVRSAILLHDNARPHTAALTRKNWIIFRGKHWKIRPTVPIYRYVTTTCSGSLEEKLGGHHFHVNDSVKRFMSNWSGMRPDSFLMTELKIFRFDGEMCE